ncbi:MAG TPA: dihydropteroate synthase [Bacteroidales bacterium]|nr:dihydropteroate synthase [Bacteroidales bacterium]
MKVRGNLMDLSVPKVMGIINITPDSFYGLSRSTDEEDIITVATEMIENGADILDVGGYSSRPGADEISYEEERGRVMNAVKVIARELPEAVISVDTFRSEIAREAVLEYGAAIINDISGGESDPEMFPTISKIKVPYILMHMQGVPGTMQLKPEYDDVVADILKWFGERIFRLQSMGVADIIIDPGFGFGKTAAHNFALLRRLGELSVSGLPLLVGISRKSMIWKTLDITPEDALTGTIVLNTVALMNGADILRVHDVKEAVEAVELVKRLRT